MLTFVVEQDDDLWTIKRQRQILGRYSDRVHAIAAAIDLANDEGNADRGETVAVEEGSGSERQTVWTYGKDAYPSSSGKPGDSRTRGTHRLP